MAEARSALARRAAWRAFRGSAPTTGADLSASASIRATRSAIVPSLAWKVTPFSFSSQTSKPARRSSSQKNWASFSRADSTRALPAATSAPPSAASMLATTTNCAASLPVVRFCTAK